jgi:hypothetical protein
MGVKSTLAKVPTPTCWFGTEQVIFFFVTSFVVLSTNKLGNFGEFVFFFFFFLLGNYFFLCKFRIIFANLFLGKLQSFQHHKKLNRKLVPNQQYLESKKGL